MSDSLDSPYSCDTCALDGVEDGRDEFADDEGMLSVDDEGNVINPAAEGSCLMAERLAGEGSVFSPYVPDFDAEARQRDALAFFAQNPKASSNGTFAEVDEAYHNDGNSEEGILEQKGPAGAALSCDRAVKENGSSLHQAPPSGSDERDGGGDNHDDDDDDDGDLGLSYVVSRVLTDPDDWVLEAILQRKVNKEHEGGPWVYRCRWKGYDEPTWETREAMEDAGWIPQLDAFDSREARGNEKASARRYRNPPRKRKVLDYARLIEGFFAPNDAALCEYLEAKGLRFYHYSRMNVDLAANFYALWSNLKATHVPTILFHGTRPANLPSIYRQGLVPGGTNGVAITHGSAFGRGVYTAQKAEISVYYADTSCSLLICVGLVPVKGDDANVVKNGDYVIFRDPAFVYPMWIIQFDGHYQWLAYEPEPLDRELFFYMASTGFGKYAPLDHVTVHQMQSSILQRQHKLQQQQSSVTPAVNSEEGQALTDSELSYVRSSIRQIRGSSGGIKKAALKAQPRKIKDLLARLAKQRND